jgi:uncharacterized membrane protein YedE/YeeE
VIELFQDRGPWYVTGPLLGLVVVAVMALLNQRLGVVGGFAAVVERLDGRADRLAWKAWFLFGIVLGGLLFGVLGGGWQTDGDYGWLTETFTGSWSVLVPVGLLLAGTLIGFGARMARGCTSGNGLAGCSLAQPSSFAATATFMGTAIAASFVIRWLTGGGW